MYRWLQYMFRAWELLGGSDTKCNYLWMSISGMRMTGFKEEIAQSQPQRLTIGVTPVLLITVLQSCMHLIILCHGHTQALCSCGVNLQQWQLRQSGYGQHLRVCATPPPHPPVKTENADTEGEAAACEVISQLSL